MKSTPTPAPPLPSSAGRGGRRKRLLLLFFSRIFCNFQWTAHTSSMGNKYLGYHYEVTYKTNGNECKITIKSSELDQQFPNYSEGVSSVERENVVTFVKGKLPSEAEFLIERKNTFEEEMNITRIATVLVKKWSSWQTFSLTSEQEQAFHFLESEVSTIALKYDEWITLFNLNELFLLQRIAPSTFSLIRESMMRDIIQSIMRLFDPVETTKKKIAHSRGSLKP